MSLDELRKEYEFNNKTCEALLLQFKEPKVSDLTIPYANDIYYLVVISGRLMNGEKINPESINCITSHYWYNLIKEEYFSKLSPKVSEGLMKVLDFRKGSYSHLEQYMIWRDDILHKKFCFGKGTWYKIRDNKKEKLEKGISEYFNKKELDDFNQIGILFQPYIDRVGAPCPAS